MGWYVRRSVKLGPFRLSASKSGLNVSAGVRGLRVGVGPRGQYVSAGRGGIYYRSYNSSAKRGKQTDSTRTPGPRPIPLSPESVDIQDATKAIHSADALEIRDETAAGLLDELNRKRRRPRYGRMVFVAALAVFLIVPFFHSSMATTIATAGFLAAIPISVATMWWDSRAKRTYLIYDLDEDYEGAYKGLFDALGAVGAAKRIWYITTTRGVSAERAKYEAGAGALITRNRTRFKETSPPSIKTNVSVIGLNFGKRTFYFFPDRLLVVGKRGVGAANYRELNVDIGSTRFIETDGVPKDAKVVDTTWQYVNKKGGPDRRFKDNNELPICEYESIALSSASGVDELLYVSRTGKGSELAKALSAIHSLADKRSI